MPQKKAAMKAMRRDAKNAARNRLVQKKIKDLRKKAEKALASKKKDEAEKAYRELQQLFDKVSRSGHYMHVNTARRYKSRLAAKLKSLA